MTSGNSIAFEVFEVVCVTASEIQAAAAETEEPRPGGQDDLAAQSAVAIKEIGPGNRLGGWVGTDDPDGAVRGNPHGVPAKEGRLGVREERLAACLVEWSASADWRGSPALGWTTGIARITNLIEKGGSVGCGDPERDIGNRGTIGSLAASDPGEAIGQWLSQGNAAITCHRPLGTRGPGARSYDSILAVQLGNEREHGFIERIGRYRIESAREVIPADDGNQPSLAWPQRTWQLLKIDPPCLVGTASIPGCAEREQVLGSTAAGRRYGPGDLTCRAKLQEPCIAWIQQQRAPIRYREEGARPSVFGRAGTLAAHAPDRLPGKVRDHNRAIPVITDENAPIAQFPHPSDMGEVMGQDRCGCAERSNPLSVERAGDRCKEAAK